MNVERVQRLAHICSIATAFSSMEHKDSKVCYYPHQGTSERTSFVPSAYQYLAKSSQAISQDPDTLVYFIDEV